MCISGAIFIENVVVQQLTNYVWTGVNPYDDKMLESVARLFKALSMGLENLKMFYHELKIVTKPELRRLFPFTRFYPGNSQLIIKFVQRYNSHAHRLLASYGLAPQLHYSSLDDPNSKTMGALGMVVMDYVGETDHYELYSKGLLPNIYEGVKQAVHILHSESIVFGDLRVSNIVITELERKPMLVGVERMGSTDILRV
jgi:hypothetical protein